MTDPVTPSTSGDLARIRARFAGCELLVLADVEAGTVLGWDGAVKVPQEELDALCGMAEDLLMADPSGPAHALMVRPTGGHAFLRGPGEGREVLCGVFAPRAGLNGMAEAGAELFRRIGGAA